MRNISRSAKATRQARQLWSSTNDWNDVLQRLRSAGFDMPASRMATCQVLGVSLHQALEIVLDSPAWADMRDATIEANELLWDYLAATSNQLTADGSNWTATLDLEGRSLVENQWFETAEEGPIGVDDGLTCLGDLVANAAGEGTDPTFAQAWAAFKAFALIPVDTPSDLLLFEVGVFRFTGDEMFHASLTRQFEVHVDGAYDHLEQLRCEFTYQPTTALRDLGRFHLWRDEGSSLRDFIHAVQTSDPFLALQDELHQTFELDQGRV